MVALSAEAPDGWTAVDFSNPYVNVAEGGEETVTLSITVPENTAKYRLVIYFKKSSKSARKWRIQFGQKFTAQRLKLQISQQKI